MKRRSWAGSRRLGFALAAALVLLMLGAAVRAGAGASAAIEPRRAELQWSDGVAPNVDEAARWTSVALPDRQAGRVAWYRVRFELSEPHEGAGTWMLYLPYFYGGGRVWLNGVPVATVTESSDTLHVRWESPVLLPLPESALRAGENVLQLRVAPMSPGPGLFMPRPMVGPQAALQPWFDRRFLLAKTVPVITVSTGVVAAAFMIFVWWRRRQEVAYGLFGLAALCWAIRTNTFIFDAVPTAVWPYWRTLYYASTGGFVAVMALFALCMAGWLRARLAWATLVYVALGPATYLGGTMLGLPGADDWVARWWVLGLIPMGLAVGIVSGITAFRRRGAVDVSIFVAVVLAFVAGVHDYAVALGLPWLERWLPQWAGHRIFVLHHGANLLLVVMGGSLAARFVRSLQSVENANVELHARVAQRERELAVGYDQIAAMQRDQAASEERQRIMQELHDGVGAMLVSTLLRAQRGALTNLAMGDAMRGAIDEMRVAIEALTSDDGDLRTAFGNFRFRWDARLRDAGLTPHWQVDLPSDGMTLAPHDTLQLLRVAQEALVNVLKHAQARQVWIWLTGEPGQLRLEVADDGRGLPAASELTPGGRGLVNLRHRAARLQARLWVTSTDQPAHAPRPGTYLAMLMPLSRA